MSYTLAKHGELPKIFERKVWKDSGEGLFITAGLVLLIVNFMDLGGIAMLGSASFLLIYLSVNVAHYRLTHETRGKKWIITLSILLCILAFLVLAYYIITTSPITLVVLGIVIILCFLGEWVYRKMVERELVLRIHR